MKNVCANIPDDHRVQSSLVDDEFM